MAVETTVIIPARNEEKTIGAIVRTFQEYAPTAGNVYVAIDADTTDSTVDEVKAAGGTPITGMGMRGKGQVVARALTIVACGGPMLSSRIILCDADYTGLTVKHINDLLKPNRGMVIGVPDWPDVEVPEHVIHAWPRVSGFRCLDWPLIPDDAHGYLLETQLNLRAVRYRTQIKQVYMEGLKSPFQWPLSDQRMAELLRDREWGLRNGVL
jgi:glycosyltransferase involved in cell wall biosynthesis